MEPLYQGPWDHENYLVISGFSLYQGKKQRNIKSWEFSKITLFYKRVLLYGDLFITRIHCHNSE